MIDISVHTGGFYYMKENNHPLDLSKIAVGSRLLELQIKSANLLITDLAHRVEQIGSPVDSIWSETLQNNISRMSQIVAKSLTANWEPFKTATLITDINKKLTQSALDALRPFPEGFKIHAPFTELVESIGLQHVRTIERMTESIKQASTLNLASSLQELARTIEFDAVVSDHLDVIPEVEVLNEVVHERLEQVAGKEQEETGKPVPYNALSMKFIINVYLPCLDIAHSLDTVETIDSEIAVRFIMFNVLPLVYYFSTKDKDAKSDNVDFDRDLIFSDQV